MSSRGKKKGHDSGPINQLGNPSHWLRKHNWEVSQIRVLLHNLRQILAVAIGLAWGFSQVTGWVGILSFLVVNMSIGFVYINKYLQVDVNEEEGKDLMQEGFMTSVGLFFLSWILSYTYVRGEIVWE